MGTNSNAKPVESLGEFSERIQRIGFVSFSRVAESEARLKTENGDEDTEMMSVAFLF